MTIPTVGKSYLYTFWSWLLSLFFKLILFGFIINKSLSCPSHRTLLKAIGHFSHLRVVRALRAAGFKPLGMLFGPRGAGCLVVCCLNILSCPQTRLVWSYELFGPILPDSKQGWTISVWSNKALRTKRKPRVRPTDEPDHPAVVVSLSTLVVTLLTHGVLRLRVHSLNQTGETERQPYLTLSCYPK